MTEFTYLIKIDELKMHLAEAGWRILDCRFDLMQPAKEFEEYSLGHIPGALYANLDEDLAGPVTESTGRHPLPSPGTFAETLGVWGIDNESQVVVYDHASGAIAARLWWMLKWIGHERVALLDGGYATWQQAGNPVSDSEEKVAARKFRPAPDDSLVISTGELRATIEFGDAVAIVDARDRGRFEGRREPIDSMAGHIPGALNHPFSEGIDADGRWKSRDELREGWIRTLGDPAQQPWISMCGSGVTACHLALSAGLAGYGQPRLYVGSWSEWIRDPGRPVATGPD
jgi:thiosulfate/3-mercaptopyruvate sulfurtransferase